MRSCFLIKRINILIFLSLTNVILAVPYIFWYLFGSLYIVVNIILVLVLFVSTGYYFIKKGLLLDRNDKLWLFVWSVYICTFAFYAFLMLILRNDLYEFRKWLGLSFKFLFLLSLVAILKEYFSQYLKRVFQVNVVIIVLSIILFFLLAFGTDLPMLTFTKIDTRPHFVFWIGATNIIFDFGGFYLIRIAGFADEPGWFALIITYLIVINEMTYGSSKLRLILLFGGLLTFSLAFYLTIPIFGIFWITKRILNIRIVPIIGSIIVVFIALGQIKEFKPIFKMFTVFAERFEKGDGGKYKGDNRSQSFPVQINAFLSHPVFGVGTDPAELKKIRSGDPSFFSYLAMHGIWGMVFLYLPVYLLIALNLKKKELILLIAIFINYFQRPGIEDMFSIMALTIIFYASINTNKQLCNT